MTSPAFLARRRALALGILWFVALGIGFFAYEAFASDSILPNIAATEIERSPSSTQPTVQDTPFIFTPIEHDEGSITGRVVDTQGAPVAGARVLAGLSRVHESSPDYETLTTRDGSFELAGLRAGHSYQLVVSARNIGSKELFADVGDDLTITLAAGSDVSHATQDTDDAETGVVFGRVTDEFGVPVQGYAVRLVSGDLREAMGGRGMDQLDGNAPPPPGRPVAVGIGGNWGGGSVNLSENSPEELREVRVSSRRIVSRGSPRNTDGEQDAPSEQIEEVTRTIEVIERVSQDLQRRVDESDVDEAELRKMLELIQQHVGGRNAVRTDENGMFRIEGVAVGDYTLLVVAGHARANVENVTVTADTETRADVAVESRARLHVEYSLPEGFNLNRMRVSAANESGEITGFPGIFDLRDEFIKYVGIEPGRYTLTFRPSNLPHVTREVTLGPGVNRLSLEFDAPAVLQGSIRNSVEGGELPERTTLSVTSDAGVFHNVRPNNRTHAYKISTLTSGGWTLALHDQMGNELYNERVWVNEGENNHDIVVTSRAALHVTIDVDESEPARGVITLSLRCMDAGRLQAITLMRDGSNTPEHTFYFLEPGKTYTVSARARGSHWQSMPVELRSGTNTVRLSVGPPNSVRVTSVAQGSQAERLGIRVGDVIISYNDVATTNRQALTQAVAEARQREAGMVMMTLERDGQIISFVLESGQIGINISDHRR
jgi:hypothetical protein